jgi:carboxyl-terminal processing protease
MFTPQAAFSQEDMEPQGEGGRSDSTDSVVIDISVKDVIADFDVVWQTISESYVDADFGGVDWQELKDEYRVQLEAASDPGIAYELLGEMVDRLANINTFVIAPWQLSSGGDEPLLEYGGVGIYLQQLDSGEVMVLHVFKETPAEAARVLVGDLIVGVNDWRVEGENPISQIADRVRGPVDTSVSLVLRDPDGVERTVDVTRARIDLRPSVEDRLVDGSLGYLRIPILSEDLVQHASRALPRLLSTSGLILDLRSISGGSMAAMVQVAQWFLGAGHMGGFYARGEAQSLDYRTDAIPAYLRPVVLLTNIRTYGVAEILVYLLNEYDRVKLVGNRTSGGYEISRPVELPSGGALNVAVGWYLAPNGTPLPQEGIAPDVEVEVPDLATVREGRDLYIEAAVDVLRNPNRR